MFGSLGVPELLLIFAVVLIVFGPRKIPEAMGEFRKATDDLKNTIEREVRLEELKQITPPTLESFMTPDESVSRTTPVSLYETPIEESVTVAEQTQPAAAPEAPVPEATAPEIAPADEEAPRS
jgi:Sec-independent protein translocase protein TatA